MSAPGFSGWRAVVLHAAGEGTDRLVRQLGLLVLEAVVHWQPLDLARTPADVVFVDADQGWGGLLPWGTEAAPVPVVALLQSEAPGRIAWAIAQGASAIVAKPVVAASVYPALVLAAAIHAERAVMAERVRHLEERLRLRPLVHQAVQQVMAAKGLEEEAAWARLRLAAMQRRITLEQAAGDYLAGITRLPEVG